MKVQETLFSTIERLNPNQKLIELIIEALNSSRSSAYKKINLETKLGFDEILVLIEKFNISFDQHIMNKASPIPFYSDALRKMPEKPIDYQKFRLYLNV